MSTESPSDVVPTATVVIFSPDMKKIIVIVNEKLQKALPPGGKFDSKVDVIILDTALRETGQEIRLALFPGTGSFLDKDGNLIDDPEHVQVENFIFTHDGKKGKDFLFFFRLHEMVGFDLKGEFQGHFITRAQIEKGSCTIKGKTYPFGSRMMISAILKIM